jgi:hypothetical protein
MNKKIYIGIGVGVFILVIIIGAYVIFSRPADDGTSSPNDTQPSQQLTQEQNDSSPTDYPVPTYVETDVVYSEEYLESVAEIHASEEAELQQAKKVGELLDEIPYQGENFTLDYSFETFSFVLTLDQDAVAEGNAEFESYISRQGIEKKASLGELQIMYE